MVLFTREVIKCSRDVFRWVSIRCVADHQTGFPHRSVAQQDALQQPLLRLSRPGGFGFMRRHWRGHGPSVIHCEWRWLSISQALHRDLLDGLVKHPPWEQVLLCCRFPSWLWSHGVLVRKSAPPVLRAVKSSVASYNPLQLRSALQFYNAREGPKLLFVCVCSD